MKNMNHKGRLQEIYAGKDTLPKYEAIQDPSSISNNPIWTVTVTLAEGNHFTARGRGKKKTIEQLAAKKALDYLDTGAEHFIEEEIITSIPVVKKSVLPISPILSTNSVILVDIENQANIYKYVEELPKDIPIIIFGSCGGPALEVVRETMPDAEIVEVPSTRPNAADIGMCLAFMTYVHRGEYEKYIILSNDKFSGVLVDCAKANFMDLMEGITVEWYRTVQGMLRALNT